MLTDRLFISQAKTWIFRSDDVSSGNTTVQGNTARQQQHNNVNDTPSIKVIPREKIPQLPLYPLKTNPTYYANTFNRMERQPNCQDLIRQSASEIQYVQQALHFYRNRTFLTDELLARETQYCQNPIYQSYPNISLSQEEKYYPIAFSLTVYRNAEQVERLIRSIYTPQNYYCIHVDKKSPPAFLQAMMNYAKCFNNIIVLNLISVIPATFSRIQADLYCMKSLLFHHHNWKYWINLSGEEYPLMTNKELVRYLKSLHGQNEIESIAATHLKARYQYHYYLSTQGQYLRSQTVKPPLQSGNIQIYKGDSFIAATYEFCNFIIHNATARIVLNYFRDTFLPSENIWATFQRLDGIPGAIHLNYSYQNKPILSKSRLTNWGTTHCYGWWVNGLCTYAVGDLRWLFDKAGEYYLFASKVDIKRDHVVIDCIELARRDRMMQEIATTIF